MHVERFKQWVSQILVRFQPKLDAGSVSHNHGNGEPTNSTDSIQPGDAEIESDAAAAPSLKRRKR